MIHPRSFFLGLLTGVTLMISVMTWLSYGMH